MPRLYIIGNGFDRHHHMPSGYQAFASYVEKKDADLYETVSEFLFWDHELWADFENNLAHLDEDAIIDEASNYLASYAADDWSDDSHHSYQRRIGEIVRALSGGLRGHFTDWIKTLQAPPPGGGFASLNIDPAALFLSFNYTATLQMTYRVPDTRVLHIHGRSDGPPDEIVLGHGWKQPDRKPLFDEDGQETDERDTRIIEGEALIRRYFSQTMKPTEAILAANAAAFEGLRVIDEIWVMGHSFAQVDLPYFAAVRDHARPGAAWKVSYHKDEERLEFAEELRKLGVSDSKFALMPMLAF